MKLRKLLLPMAIVIAAIAACNKDDDSTTSLKIKLTDNPYNATEVNVDLQQVRVNFSGDSSGWTDLTTRAGIYNLLDFQNGMDTVIAEQVVPTGTLKEIRFVLGNRNSIKINNVVYPLTIPSGSSSGLKLKVDKKLNADLDSLIVDFDAALSIHQTGTGEFNLSPVLKIK